MVIYVKLLEEYFFGLYGMKGIRVLGTSIISLAKHWCSIKGENYVDNL
jgi:hypothetical protein